MSKNLNIQNVDCVELARNVGTPLMVYDQTRIEKRLADFKKYFTSDVFQCDVLYASKAFLCDALLSLIQESECCLDVVSGGEIYAAKRHQFPMEKVYFHGNNKSKKELEMALDSGVGVIVVDNVMECISLCESMSTRSNDVKVMFRLNPGIEAHTHQYIVTAHIDSKFGVSIQEMDTITEMIQMVLDQEHLSFYGFHAHIGSQIFDENAYVAEIETLMNFMQKVQQRMNIEIPGLNLGGGFAAMYTNEDQPIPLPRVCNVILEACEKGNKDFHLNIQHLMIEPGRSIVAEAGCTLYEVGYQKQTPHRHYVFVNGGMSDNIRPALYQAKYDCDIANRMGDEKTTLVSVAGKCCESGDILIADSKLPACTLGDILVVYTTGAYGYSMASNYNRQPRPGIVFVKDGTARMVMEHEQYEDLHRLECDKEIKL